MQKEVEISQNKVYNLPDFTIIEYQEYFLAVAVNFARGLVLTNRLQLDILNMLQKKKSIGEIFELFDNVWSCEDFGTTKADPRIYEMAAERMGKTPEEREEIYNEIDKMEKLSEEFRARVRALLTKQ